MELTMGTIAKTESARAAELRDLEGRALGCVMEPAATPLVGRGAQTVLLVRRA
jgi:hypothetical protein